MSESLILLIAVGLLAALVILLIVIARLLVGVRQALAADRAAEASAAAAATETPQETAPEPAEADLGPVETAPAGALPMSEPESSEPSWGAAPANAWGTPTAESAMEQAASEPGPEPVGSEEPVVVEERSVFAEPVNEEPAAEAEPEAVAWETGPTEAVPMEEPAPVVEATQDPVDDDPFGDTSFADGVSDQVPEPAEPQPYQRDGRWWFEREGELLVYDEVKAEWVPAAAEGSESLEQAATPEASFAESPSDAAVSDVTATDTAPEGDTDTSWRGPQEEPFIHALDEPRPEFEPVATSTYESTPAEPDTSTADEPSPAVEEPVSAEASPFETPVAADSGPFETPISTEPAPFEEPVSAEPASSEPAPFEEPVSAEASPVEEPVAAEAEAAPVEEAPQPASYWKCPSCGVVNGSTATSCRMCFTARP